VADIDDARVLSGPLQHGRPACGQPLQVHSRALVAAVFAPHDAENPEFGQRWLTFEDGDDAVVFGLIDIVLREDVFSNHSSIKKTLYAWRLHFRAEGTEASVL